MIGTEEKIGNSFDAYETHQHLITFPTFAFLLVESMRTRLSVRDKPMTEYVPMDRR